MSTHEVIGERRSASEQGASLRPGTIIAASDGLDASAGALAVGQAIAHHLGAGLEVVTVLEPANMLVPPLQPAPGPLHRGNTRIQDRRERLRVLCGRVLAGGPRYTTRILIGETASSIARAAQCHRSPLVVTGRVPHGRLERVVRRETPLATVRAAQVPVLSVPEAAARLPRCIAVAVRSGEAAARLAPICGALFHDAQVVHLVSVIPSATAPLESELRGEQDEPHLDAQRTCARAASSWMLPAEVPIEPHVLTGEPGGALATFVAAVDADLLVIGHVRRNRAVHLPGADLATRLFRTVSCATLIVPIEGHQTPELREATAVSFAAREWPTLLREFTKRNNGRTASMTIQEGRDPPGMVADEWMLSSVDCDPVSGAIAIELADPADQNHHLAHHVARPTVLAVHDARSGSDEMLVIGYAGGQLMLSLW